MSDVFNAAKRSEIMSHVKSKNTAPEVVLRSILHKAGHRFRLNRKDLPGKPDIVLPKYKTAIFVNGCFWHGHDCKRGHRPQANASFWNEKINKNIERDRLVIEELHQMDWRVLTIWSCELKKSNQDNLLLKIEQFLENRSD